LLLHDSPKETNVTVLQFFNNEMLKSVELYFVTQLTHSTEDKIRFAYIYMKSSDAKASKCHLKCSSKIIIFLSSLYI